MFNSSYGGMAEMFGMTFAVILWIPYIMVFVLLPVILYVVARWRQQKSEVADPHLGIKCGLGLFRVIAVQLALGGLWMLIYSILADGDNESLTRTAFGLMVPGGIVLGLQLVLLQRTNHAHMPMPVRLFRGLEMVQTGLAAMFGLVAAFVISVQKDPPDEMLKALWSLVVVYGGAWAFMTHRLLGDVTGPPSAEPVPPPRPSPAPAAADEPSDVAE